MSGKGNKGNQAHYHRKGAAPDTLIEKQYRYQKNIVGDGGPVEHISAEDYEAAKILERLRKWKT